MRSSMNRALGRRTPKALLRPGCLNEGFVRCVLLAALATGGSSCAQVFSLDKDYVVTSGTAGAAGSGAAGAAGAAGTGGTAGMGGTAGASGSAAGTGGAAG